MNASSIIAVILALVLVGCGQTAVDAPAPQDSLPASFTINIVRDSTSSGATRTLNASYTFEGQAFVSAIRQEFVSSSEAERLCTQTWDGRQWQIMWGCEAVDPVLVEATSRSGIERLVADGTLVPAERCAHWDYCYTIST